MKLLSNKKGFGAVGVFGILIIVALLGIGWYVWRQNHKDQSPPLANPSSQPEQQQPQNKPDPYEGWGTYESSSYGVSFRYPPGWKTEEIEVTEPPSAGSILTVEKGVYLKRDKEEKYNNTVSIEVFTQSIEKISSIYESGFAQASTTQVTKTTENLKGKTSVQFKLNNSEQTRFYLFAVDDKTYVFSSTNEWFNIYNDAEYWAKFDKVFESFKFTN